MKDEKLTKEEIEKRRQKLVANERFDVIVKESGVRVFVPKKVSENK